MDDGLVGEGIFREQSKYVDSIRPLLKDLNSLSSVVNLINEEGSFLGGYYSVDVSSYKENLEQALSSLPLDNGKYPSLINSYEEKDFETYTSYYSSLIAEFEQLNESTNNGGFNNIYDRDDKGIITTPSLFDDHVSVVPDLYFQTDYLVEKHPIFSQPIKLSIELLSELTKFFDNIEKSIYKKTATKANAHVIAIEKAKELQNELEVILNEISETRSLIYTLNNEKLENLNKIVNLSMKKSKIIKMASVLSRISSIKHVQPTIQRLLSDVNYEEALNLIENALNILKFELDGYACVKTLTPQLCQLLISIDQLIESEILKHAITYIFDSPPPPTKLSPEYYAFHSSQCQLLSLLEGDVSIGCADPFGEVQSVGDWGWGWVSEYGPKRDEADFLNGGLMKASQRRGLLPRVLQSLKVASTKNIRKVIKHSALNDYEKYNKLFSNLRVKTTCKLPFESVLEEFEIDNKLPISCDSENSQQEEGPTNNVKDNSNKLTHVIAQVPHSTFLMIWINALGLSLSVCKHIHLWATELLAAYIPSHDRNPNLTVGDVSRVSEIIVTSLFSKLCGLLHSRVDSHSSLSPLRFASLYWTAVQAANGVYEMQEKTQSRLESLLSDVGDEVVHLNLLGPVSSGLRLTLASQSKAVLEEFHQKKMTQLAYILDNERWEKVEVPSDFIYESLGRWLIGVKKVISANSSKSRVLDLKDIIVDNICSVNNDGVEDSSDQKNNNHEEKTFLAISSTLALIQIISEYITTAYQLPYLSLDLMSRIIILLKAFIKISVNLILKGEAVKKNILKRISSNNLALASQSYACLHYLTPTIFRALTNAVESAGNHATQFHLSSSDTHTISIADPVKKAMGISPVVDPLMFVTAETNALHQEFHHLRKQVYIKLSDILVDRFETLSGNWLTSPHGICTVSGGDLRPPPHPAIEALVKDIGVLHKVLGKSLPEKDIKQIFARTFQLMRSNFAEIFESRYKQGETDESTVYTSDEGLSVGARYIMDCLFLLEWFGGWTKPLEEILFELIEGLVLVFEREFSNLEPHITEIVRQRFKNDNLLNSDSR